MGILAQAQKVLKFLGKGSRQLLEGQARMWSPGSVCLSQQLPAQTCPFIHPATAASSKPILDDEIPSPPANGWV